MRRFLIIAVAPLILGSSCQKTEEIAPASAPEAAPAASASASPAAP
jgi:hypothetical protein